jgi:hypothetical protein
MTSSLPPDRSQDEAAPSDSPSASGSPSASDSNDATPTRRRTGKRELLYAAGGFITGFIVLPLLIFIVGSILLGPYAGGKSLGDFYIEFYGNLFHGAPRTWIIALSPYLAIWAVRLSFRRTLFGKAGSPSSPVPPAADEPVAQTDSSRSRREPFISA